MAGMPGMDKAKDDDIDLAVIMGKPKGDKPSKKPMAVEPESEEGELPPGFESAFAEAFPDAADDMDRMMAMKRLIESCHGEY